MEIKQQIKEYLDYKDKVESEVKELELISIYDHFQEAVSNGSISQETIGKIQRKIDEDFRYIITEVIRDYNIQLSNAREHIEYASFLALKDKL